MTRYLAGLIPAMLFLSAAVGGKQASPAADAGRELIAPQWWTKASAIVRVSLKQRGNRPGFPMNQVKASAELDALRANGVSAIEIFGPSYSGNAYGGLDPIDRYRPAAGTIEDFRRLVRLIHSKGMAVITFDNLGYISLDAPEWGKACDDVRAGRQSREARWFRWSERPDAPAPADDSIFLLLDPHRVWRYGHGPDNPAPPEGFLSLDWAGRGQWEFSQRAGKYYWTKWGMRDSTGKRIGLPHYDWANPEWQEEAEKILRFWMDTGIDGIIMDAPGMYIDCGWEMTRRRITSVISSYGNVYMQPEGGGSLYENPGVWLSEGGYNSMQDYPLLDLSGTGSVSPIRKALENGDPRPIEAALRGYHDRVVEEGGVLYLTAGARLQIADPHNQELALATAVLVGDILSYGPEQALQIGPRLQRLLELKRTHPALQNLSTRRQVPTTADNKYYVFLRTAADRSERILVVMNFQPSEQTIDIDLSGVATAGLVDLEEGTSSPRLNPFKVSLPAYSYRLYQVKPAAKLLVAAWTSAAALMAGTALSVDQTTSPTSAPATAPTTGSSVPTPTPGPPMGWNSWNAYGSSVLDEQTLLANARILAEKYKPSGYDTFCVDGGWLTGIDEFGRLKVNTRRFPRGMKAFVADVHALGLKAGVHIMRGIPRLAVRQNLPIHGTAYLAQDVADTNAISSWSNSHYGVNMDKPGAQEYYDDWVALVASYGVDFIKADDLMQFPRELKAIAIAVRKVNRPIVLSLSPGDKWDTQNLSIYRLGDMMRLTSDIWDKRSDLDVGFEGWLKFSQALEDPGAPGVWPDLDMIPFGHLRVGVTSRPGGRPSFEGNERWCRFTPEQKCTFITQRALAASPLIVGGQLMDMDPDSFELLTNLEMIACNQNGVVGRRVYAEDKVEVWQTRLRGQKGEGWLGIFNRDVETARVRLTKTQLGLTGADSFSLQDIWRKRPMVVGDAALELELGPDDVCFVKYQASSGPGRKWVVNQRHPKAADSNGGSEEAPLKTINAAAQLAGPGDTVLVRSGVYRERVAPARGGEDGKPIMYIAAPGEMVEIKGSDVWTPQWEPVAGHEGVYMGKLDAAMFRTGAPEGAVQEYNPYTIKHQVLTNRTVGQVFVDGARLPEMEALDDVFAQPGAWKTDGQSLTVHFPRPYATPEKHLVELSVRGRIFAPYQRGLGYIQVKGFIMSHCANNACEGFYNRGSKYPQAGALGCRGGHHWLIEGNSIRWANGVGVDCGIEGPYDLDGLKQPSSREAGNHVIRNNVISDNGAAGIVGHNPRATRILGNTLERNHYLGYNGMESAAIKLHSLNGGIIEGNLLRDNATGGIWLDNGARGTRITRNVFVGNLGAGLFLELGTGPTLVDNNILALTLVGDGRPGDGVYSHDASGITLAHNLIWFNAHFGVWAHIGRVAAPSRSSASRWRIINNVIVGNSCGAISFPTVTDRSSDNFSDQNLLAGAYNLMTSETSGAPMDAPFFLCNGNKGLVGIDELAAQFSNAMDTANLPSGERPNLAAWKKVPYLTLDQWEAWTGSDRNSLVPIVLRPEMAAQDRLELSFLIDDSPTRVGCRPVEGVDKDFFGQPIKAHGVILPGPFQSLVFELALADHKSNATPFRGEFEKLKSTSQNLNRLVFWPLRQVEVNAPTYTPPPSSTAPPTQVGLRTNGPATGAASQPVNP